MTKEVRYSLEEDDGYFHHSLEDAVKYSGGCGTMTIYEGVCEEPIRMSHLAPISGYLIDEMMDAAYEVGGEDMPAAIFDPISEDARKDLEKRMKTMADEWADAHDIQPKYRLISQTNEIEVDVYPSGRIDILKGEPVCVR